MLYLSMAFEYLRIFAPNITINPTPRYMPAGRQAIGALIIKKTTTK